jgi:hypothetical protein
MPSPEREQLAYAAGVIDSGAQISTWHRVPTLRLQRRDPAVLHRVATIVREGAVFPPTKGARGRWMFRAEGPAVRRIAEKLQPWLSPGRLEEVDSVTAAEVHQ